MKSKPGQRVLIAEDSRVISDVMRLSLNRAGFVTEAALNGRLAWERLLSERFDLLITDFQMPEIEGDELCRLLRQCPVNDDIPVILVSSKGFELDLETLQNELGIAELVYKPFSPRKIVETVTSVLERATLAQPH
jgi:two-component system alkaline phosphatase synthesis response regulator PhoP